MVRRIDREPELFAAVLDLLREVGYERLTMDAVSARAHVSKATIYRHWPGKPQLVAEALRQKHFETAVLPDTGDLRDDLLAMLQVMARMCMDDAPMLQSIAFAMQSNAELAEIVRAQVLPEKRCDVEDVIRRAVERGQLPATALEFDLVHELVPALLLTRFIAHGQPLDDEYMVRVVDQILIPLLHR
ncbi:AcrR family transcriptional regulator [Allocatelliglobosispora scoriae]|uniref:AcrR family transcriptional regulator n=1 Tax=Allocatelliglobosispora scoriae TaxID=643052 RepID=A0A841BVG6_9ACTN|nr:TetR/AcrR family transcriptional regulator [Allocatelliglobosispora scoriae]MBB5870760.1 AcrR family transcriptional regulator [Allocatelliglobosispora scoriae]